MNVIVTKKGKIKYHYDDIKEIYLKDWSSLIVFDTNGSMGYHNADDIIKVEIVIEKNKQFQGQMAVFNE